MMLKRSLYLVFVLQIYVSVESLEEKEDFLGVTFVLFNELSTKPGFILS